MKNFIFKVPSSEPEPNKQQLLLLLRSNRNEPLTGEHILIIHDVKHQISFSSGPRLYNVTAHVQLKL